MMEEYLVKNELKKDYDDPERIWTVYVHIVPNDVRSAPGRDDYYDKYYVGITSRDVKLRWINGFGYKGQPFYNAINKYGWDNIQHEIVAQNLTLDEASEMEKALIRELKSCIYTDDYGYNATLGGFDSNICVPVMAYDSQMNFLQSYESLNAAFRDTGISTDNIFNCCKSGQLFRGYYFKFDESSPKLKKDILRHNQHPLYKIDRKTGEILERFNTAEEVIEKYKFNRGNFYQVLNRIKKHEWDGYMWLYEDDYLKNGGDEYVKSIIAIPYEECNGNWGRTVYMYDIHTQELLNVFDGLKDANEKTKFPVSSISSCLTGNLKSYKRQFLFSYHDNFEDARNQEYKPRKNGRSERHE